MRRAIFVLTLVAAMVFACAGVVLAQQQERTAPSPSQGDTPPKTPTEKIPDTYIVVFDEDAVEEEDPRAVANEQAQANGLELKHVYRHALKGYAAKFPNDRARQRVENDERVSYVEQDGVVNAVAQTLPWGINKVDADLSSTLAGNGSGAITNVNAYIIDTGIGAHTDLNKAGHVNFAGGPNDDCNGHGTHVAGSVAARDNTSDVVGVIPGAPLYGVKLLGCNGTGSWSGVIAGVDYVTRHNASGKKKVANMSLSGGANKAVDDAVRNSAAKGIFYALAAGNDGGKACDKSPVSAGAGTNNGIMTVAATDSSDREASWSNYDTCVDIWAPGVSILSTRKGGGTTTMSGTSMASPHAAGGGGLYLSKQTTASPSTVESALKSAATTTSNKSKDGRTITREYVRGF
jgi:subtilisin family serine protease